LQCEAAEDKSNAEDPEPTLRKIVGIVFDVRIDCRSDARDNARDQPYTDRKKPDVIDTMDEGATDKRRDKVTEGTDGRSRKLKAGKTWTASRLIFHCRTHAARIGQHLPGGDENSKRGGESKTHNSVKSRSESDATDGGEQSFPGPGIMIQAATGSIKFNRESDARCNTGSKTKEETKTKAVADAENDGVSHCPRKQPQRAMLSPQKVVSQIETTQDIKTAARNADRRQCMVIHSMIVAVPPWFLRSNDSVLNCLNLESCLFMDRYVDSSYVLIQMQSQQGNKLRVPSRTPRNSTQRMLGTLVPLRIDMNGKNSRVVRAGERTNLDGKAVSNKVLLAMPENEYELMRPDLTYVNLPHHLSLHESTQKIEFVYFPNRGMVSQVVVTKDGRTVEVGVVGNEGYVGAGLAAGLSRSSVREIMQIAGDGFRITGNALERILRSAPRLQVILNRHTGLQGMQVAQTAACNRLHDIQQRLSRWLLMTQDRVDSGALPITHDFIATMMGTDRSSVSLAASALQKKGILEYLRGAVKIVNRRKLEKSACECYDVIQKFEDELGLR
jgi:CRP-like cAMP-binding protein